MNEFVSSPWFESLHTATQVPLAMLAILVTGLGTFAALKVAYKCVRAAHKWGNPIAAAYPTAPVSPDTSKATHDSVPPGELCRTILHLLGQPMAWSTALDAQGRFLRHSNGRLVVRVNGNDVDAIQYLINGSDIEAYLSEDEVTLLDKAAMERKDVVMAAVAGCADLYTHPGTVVTADQGHCLPPVPAVQRNMRG